MKAYLGVFRMRMVGAMQYRAAAWAGIATQFFWGFIKIMVFWAFYRSAITAAPMPFGQVADYVWLGQAFLMMTMLWVQDNDLLKSITSGNITYELCRPYGIYLFWFSRLMAFRLAGTLMRAVPILVIALFLPEPYKLRLPPDPASALLFLVSIALAALLVVSFSMFIYLLTFITMSPLGPRLLLGTAGEFMMGGVIPIPLMPQGLQTALSWLPFRYMADLPFRIYSGNIAGTEALHGLAIQLLWIVTLTIAGAYGFKNIQRRVLIQGG